MDEQGKTRIKNQIKSLKPFGKTSLFDAIAESYSHLHRAGGQSSKIRAVIVLSDGADTASNLNLELLAKRITYDADQQPIMILTIGYGEDADETSLKDIAERTLSKYYQGEPGNIRRILTDSAAFFSPVRDIRESARLSCCRVHRLRSARPGEELQRLWPRLQTDASSAANRELARFHRPVRVVLLSVPSVG